MKNERIWSYVKETTSHLQRGLDFRPDYQKVGILQSILDSPVLALSATITYSIRKYIDRVLHVLVYIAVQT
jgi:superfamily II DNA helicase RecQ